MNWPESRYKSVCCRVLVGTALAVSMCVPACDVGPCEHTGPHDEKRATQMQLEELVVATLGAVFQTNQYSPLGSKAYADWLLANSGPARSHVAIGLVDYDPASGLFLDGWKRPIVLFVESDTVLGLGSSGPNGRWEQGEGDDIVVRFEAHGVPTGPAGELLPEN